MKQSVSPDGQDTDFYNNVFFKDSIRLVTKTMLNMIDWKIISQRRLPNRIRKQSY